MVVVSFTVTEVDALLYAIEVTLRDKKLNAPTKKYLREAESKFNKALKG